jgi:hypothetical protein
MVGLMDDMMAGGQGGMQAGQPRQVAVPQPQGPNALNILASELQQTQARLAQLEQVVMRIVSMLQRIMPNPPGGGQPQPQPGMPPQGPPVPQGPQGGPGPQVRM